MFPEGTRTPDGAIHDFKSGAGYLALRSGCDVLPMLIRGTYQVLGKGSLIPRRHPVEVRIGNVIANAELRAIAENSDGMGAYRKLADFMHAAVISLAGTRRASSQRELPAPATEAPASPGKPHAAPRRSETAVPASTRHRAKA